MDDHTVTLTIPDELYQRLKWRSEATNQNLEALILKTISNGLYMEETGLPPEFAAALVAAEQSGNDADLRLAATPHSSNFQAAIEDLREQLKRPDISPLEKRKLEEILSSFEMREQFRSKAEDALKRRGRRLD